MNYRFVWFALKLSCLFIHSDIPVLTMSLAEKRTEWLTAL